MSVAEMQAYLARLYTSDPFRKLFELDPEATLGDYTLDEEEINALKQIDMKMLNWFAGSLKGKRRKKIAAAYPLLFKLTRNFLFCLSTASQIPDPKHLCH